MIITIITSIFKMCMPSFEIMFQIDKDMIIKKLTHGTEAETR